MRSQVSQTHRPDDPRRPFPHDVDAVEKPHAAYVYYHSRGTSDMQQAADIVGHAEALIPFPDQLLSGISNPCCEFVPSAWFPVLPQQHQKLYAVPFLQQAVEPEASRAARRHRHPLDEARPGKPLVVACFVRLSTTAFEAAKKLLQAPLSDSDHKTRREASLRNLALSEEHCKTKAADPAAPRVVGQTAGQVRQVCSAQGDRAVPAPLGRRIGRAGQEAAHAPRVSEQDRGGGLLAGRRDPFYRFKVSMTKSSQLYPGTDLRLVDEPTLRRSASTSRRASASWCSSRSTFAPRTAWTAPRHRRRSRTTGETGCSASAWPLRTALPRPPASAAPDLDP